MYEHLAVYRFSWLVLTIQEHQRNQQPHDCREGKDHEIQHPLGSGSKTLMRLARRAELHWLADHVTCCSRGARDYVFTWSASTTVQGRCATFFPLGDHLTSPYLRAAQWSKKSAKMVSYAGQSDVEFA